MNYLSVNEISAIWNISSQLVRRLCRDGRIAGAKRTSEGWLIPEDAERPERKERRKANRSAPKPKVPLTKFAKQIIAQRSKNYHYGIYEYIQINLTYSSNRMGSNRLTRNEVEEIYRTNKITTTFEPAKVDDIIETINHFAAVRFVVDNIAGPITQVLIKRIHKILTYGTYADRKERLHPGEYRTESSKYGISAKNIEKELSALVKSYEKQAPTMESIIDFHAQFELIHPFDDYNGRVGRLLLLKECIRHGIDPFIIDDKRRGSYVSGIALWKDDPSKLYSVCKEAQKRFQGKLELCSLFEYARYPTQE